MYQHNTWQRVITFEFTVILCWFKLKIKNKTQSNTKNDLYEQMVNKAKHDDHLVKQTQTNTTNGLYEQMVNKAKHEDHLVKQIQIYV